MIESDLSNPPVTVYYLNSCLWEKDFLLNDILGPICKNVIFFDKIEDISIATQNHPQILILTDTLPFQEVETFVKKISPNAIFFTSGETGNHAQWLSLSAYTPLYCKQYNHFSIGTSPTNIVQIPLGYIKGFITKYDCPLSTIRPHVWAFVGELKSDRYEMCETFARFPNNVVVISKNTWNLERQHISPQQLADIYRDAVFVPIGRGNCSLDCFRIYEAVALGAIPVIVGRKDEIKQTFYYDGHIPPFVFCENWDQAIDICNVLLANPSQLIHRQASILQWWNERIMDIQCKIKKVI